MSDVDPAVEWHTFGEYRASFDARIDAARFIIVQQQHDRPEVVGQGLIAGTHGQECVGVIYWDETPPKEIAAIGELMLVRWRAMRDRKRAQTRKLLEGS